MYKARSVIVVVVVMVRHKCKKLECPKDNSTGPKVNCLKCKSCCYLKCFGFEAGPTIAGNDTVQLPVNGMIVVMFASCMAFVCCDDTVTTGELRSASGLKFPTARDTSKAKVNDALVKEIKDMLKSIKEATDTNTADIAEIKSMTTKTEANVKKATERNENMNQNATPVGPALRYVQNYRSRSYANVAASSSATPFSANKRKRPASPPNEKLQFPTPKMGKKSDANGLQVVPKVVRSDIKPKFGKALYVSRLNPATTNEQLIEYIVGNTPVTDPSKFNVHKMIKKGIDESTLKFVSFKVEMNVEELDVLDDGSLWPEGTIVREFTQKPSNELGKFFPPLNANEMKSPTNAPNSMETAEI